MREIGSYIVRVYRRDAHTIAGVVEDVGTGCIHSFHSATDLWAVLCVTQGVRPNERKPK